MREFKLALLAATALAATAGPVWAQTQEQQTPAPQTPAQTTPKPDDAQSTTLEEVTVTAAPSEVRTSIDSVSYSLANDLQATTGTLADALRNVPSVDVDPQGNVSLRGDSNVTILIDGRPSGMLSGPGRAQAIQQLRADQYSRIEVMTNPSAAYSPEGSGGVINLVSKPNAPKPGNTTTASVRANVGDDGRWNLGLSGSRVIDRLTLSGDLSHRVDVAEQEVTRLRETYDPASQRFLPAESRQNIAIDNQGSFGRLGAEYAADRRTLVSLEFRGADFSTDVASVETYQSLDANGAPNRAYIREADGHQAFQNLGVTGRVVRKFDDSGHDWTNEIRIDRGKTAFEALTAIDVTLPASPLSFEAITNRSDFVNWAFTSAYVRPMGEAKLKLGYELDVRRPEQDNTVSRGASPIGLSPVATVSRGASPIGLSPVAALSSRFEAEQVVHAVYGTYERPLTEDLSAQIGLRLEQASVDLNAITTATTASQDYFRAYPTAHLSYALSDQQTLRASYSRRIQRPQPTQLNPFVTYQDPQNLRSGNPDLEPQETDAYEAMWQRRKGQTFYQATAYYRDTRKAFTDVASDIGGGVLLTRPENLGARQDTGVELIANGRLHPTLRYNASVNVFRQHIEADGIPGSSDRSATSTTGRVSLNWQPTQEDFVQLSGLWTGDQLLAQGVRESGRLVNLGYRRKLSETWAFQLTVRDLFDEFGDVTRYETPQFRETVRRPFGGRSGYIGLTWTMGGGPRRQQEPQFDFGQGQPTG